MSTYNMFCLEIEKYQNFLVEKSVLSGAMYIVLGNVYPLTCNRQ